MDTIICLESALEIYHAARIVDDQKGSSDPTVRLSELPLKRLNCDNVGSRAPSPQDVDLLLRQFGRFSDACLKEGPCPVVGLTPPVHVLVPHDAPRWQTDRRVSHRAPARVPDGSLVRFEDGLLLSSPEYLFLQAAIQLDVFDLVWLACELCSLYTIHPRCRRALLPAWPLTTPQRLVGYVEKACELGAYGAKKALRAAGYALGHAASRREVALALLATLPRSMGGRAIPKPQLNYDIKIDGRLGAIHNWRSFDVDACWPNEKVVIEYDSDTHHLKGWRRARDNDKREALRTMGYRVVEVSTQQFDSLVMVDDSLLRLCNYLGVRNRAGESRYDWQQRRSDLRRRLYRLDERGIEWSPTGGRRSGSA